jgi:hypothetical protein
MRDSDWPVTMSRIGHSRPYPRHNIPYTLVHRTSSAAWGNFCVLLIYLCCFWSSCHCLVSSIFWRFPPTQTVQSEKAIMFHAFLMAQCRSDAKVGNSKNGRRFRIIFIQAIIFVVYFSLKRKGRAERPGLVLRTISLQRVVLIAAQENGYDIYSPCPIGCNI